jgi:hypothetical protein
MHCPRWPLLVAVIVLVTAVVGIGLFVFPRDEQVEPVIAPTARERTPAFAFHVRRLGALPTDAIRIRKPVRTNPLLRVRGRSKLVSRKVIASITRLYRGAFLDPANWRTGAYPSLLDDFAGAAKAQARGDVRVLTAGAAAGDAYLTILPRHSTIATTVLLDRRGKPAMVLADARFRAVGRRIAGPSNTMFVSTGRFFFERVGGGWRIVGYDVRRNDDKVEAPTIGSPSPTPTGAA